MKKLSIVAIFLGLSAFYVFSRTSSAMPTTVLITSGTTDTDNGITISPPPSAGTPPPTQTPPLSSMPALHRDGIYIGSVADAFYGLVQVKVTIRNGRITDVVFLSYPDDHENSININNQAMPVLSQEAIMAQSAQVDIISGATETSIAFKESLGAALVLAKI